MSKPNLPTASPPPLKTEDPLRERAWAASLIALAAAATMIFGWWTLTGDERATRGDAELTVFVHDDGAFVAYRRTPGEGDLVRFGVRLPEPAYATVVGVQEDGVRSRLLPPSTERVGVENAMLEGAARLDGYAGREQAELWTAPVPWTDARLDALAAGTPPEGAVRAATVDLR